jgi:hypothetical protein
MEKEARVRHGRKEKGDEEQKGGKGKMGIRENRRKMEDREDKKK